MNTIESFSFSHGNIDFTVNVVCYDEFALFSDLWKMTDEHQGGITVQNPQAGRDSYKYGIPLQFSLAERIASLREAKVENPCATAYQQAQEALTRDLNASDYGFQVTAEINGVTLLDGETLGCSFDYSYDDEENLLDMAKDVFKGNGIQDEAIAAAKTTADNILRQIKALKKITA